MRCVLRRNTIVRPQTQSCDTVASIQCCDRIVVDTVCGQEALRDRVITVMQVETIRVALADSYYRVVEIGLVEVHVQIVDTIEAVEQSRQGINTMVCTVFAR